jgi:hypothetical protein
MDTDGLPLLYHKVTDESILSSKEIANHLRCFAMLGGKFYDKTFILESDWFRISVVHEPVGLHRNSWILTLSIDQRLAFWVERRWESNEYRLVWRLRDLQLEAIRQVLLDKIVRRLK